MRLIWVTRGRTWGSRFLRDGQISDPLHDYETAFLGFEDAQEVWQRIGDRVALRFADPSGKRDQSGRQIFHDFVVFSPDSENINSLEDGLRLVWPQVSEQFERSWNQPNPPASGD